MLEKYQEYLIVLNMNIDQREHDKSDIHFIRNRQIKYIRAHYETKLKAVQEIQLDHHDHFLKCDQSEFQETK